MSDDPEVVAPEEDGAENEAPKEVTQAQGEPNIENADRARAHGWVDLDAWVESGKNPDDHVGADQYMEARHRHLSSLDKLERKFVRQEKELERMRKFQEQNIAAAVAQAEAKLKASFDTMDRDEIEAAYKERDDLKRQQEEIKAAPKQEVHPEVQEWLAENTWYGKDTALTTLANTIDAEVANQNPNWTPSQVLAEVNKRMEQYIPEPQRPKARPAVTPVAAGRRVSGNGGGKTGFDALSQDEKDNFQSMSKQFPKWYPDTPEGRKKYAEVMTEYNQGKAAK